MAFLSTVATCTLSSGGAEGHEATVFGVTGQLLHAAILNGEIVKIPIPVKGVYFIRIGRYPVQKVLVY